MKRLKSSQAGDADSSRAPGLTSGLQGSVNVNRGALLLLPQWQCISFFVFYYNVIFKYFLSQMIPHWYTYEVKMIPIHTLDGLKSIPHSSRTSIGTFIIEVIPPPPPYSYSDVKMGRTELPLPILNT